MAGPESRRGVGVDRDDARLLARLGCLAGLATVGLLWLAALLALAVRLFTWIVGG